MNPKYAITRGTTSADPLAGAVIPALTAQMFYNLGWFAAPQPQSTPMERAEQSGTSSERRRSGRYRRFHALVVK